MMVSRFLAAKIAPRQEEQEVDMGKFSTLYFRRLSQPPILLFRTSSIKIVASGVPWLDLSDPVPANYMVAYRPSTGKYRGP
jgi:hypothetical protein